MNKSNVNYKLLDLLNDEEISVVCKCMDLTPFITLLKHKEYEKYTKKLGRLDKHSQLVQKLLPGIAFNLYKKGDEAVKGELAIFLQGRQEIFIQAISECMDPAITIEEIKAYGTEQIVNFYYKFQEVSVADLSREFVFVLLKLNGIAFNDDKYHEIDNLIDQKEQYLKLVNQHKIKTEKALKSQEKQISVKYEHKYEEQLGELRKKVDDYRRLYHESQNQAKKFQADLDKLQDLMNNNKEDLEAHWYSQYESEFERRKEADERSIREERKAAELRLKERLAGLEDEYYHRKEELEMEYQAQEKAYVEASAEKLEELNKQVNTIKQEKTDLETEIRTLQIQADGLKNRIEKLNEDERLYFETFDQRILNWKIDSILLNKLGVIGQTPSIQLEVPSITTDSKSKDFVIPAKAITHNVEYGHSIKELEDFFDDLDDNILLNFDHPAEVTNLILATVLNGLGIIAERCVCNHISVALSALLDLSTPLTIDANLVDISTKKVIDTINNSDSQVICINGVLDKYDEGMFTAICNECKEKYIFYSISNISDMNMMSKTLFNYAVVVDIEDRLHFPENENILIGNNVISQFAQEFDMKNGLELYKKTFERLVTHKYLKKSTALRLCQMVQTYYTITSGNSLGDILQKSIVYACDFSNADENLDELLAKCGITVTME